MRRAFASLPVVVCLFSLAGACGKSTAPPPSIPTRSCDVVVWYKPASAAAHVEVIGSWDSWARPGRILDVRDDGWRVSAWQGLAPGPYAYAIIDDGTWIADPSVPVSTFHEGNEVAWIAVPNCDVPAVRIDSAAGSADGSATLDATFLATRAGVPLDPQSVTLVSPSGEPLAHAPFTADAAAGKLGVMLTGLAAGKHAVVVHAKDAHGADAEAARATVWIEPRPFDWQDAVIYQVMVDRYRARDGSPLAEPALASGRAGGHVDGVRKAIESGDLASLGFNTLWLSPLYANPAGTFPGADGHQYSSYHGYWPTDPRALEPSVADEASIDALLASAHAHGIRVLFDVVPNHVHQAHPYFAHKNDGWFNHPNGDCICGSPTCDWATHIIDCWFAPYLPDLDWHNQVVADRASADVAWWLDRFDGDGIRIDAVPMMPRAASRRIAWDIRQRLDHPGHKTFLLGEHFTGPGGYGLIRYDIGPFGLDSEFDFPLMWALRSTLADQSAPLGDLESAIVASTKAWDGSGAVMANMIGNHDVPRFVTVAAGDGNGDNWTPAAQPTDANVYARHAMAVGLLYTLPGAPTVYYGDEVALAGHSDPDSRRVLPGEAALTDPQKKTRDTLRALARIRACSDALRRGTYRTLYVDPEHLLFAREGAGEPVIVVVQRDVASPIAVSLPGIVQGDYVDALTSRVQSLRGELTNLAAQPFSLAVLLPASSTCLRP